MSGLPATPGRERSDGPSSKPVVAGIIVAYHPPADLFDTLHQALGQLDVLIVEINESTAEIERRVRDTLDRARLGLAFSPRPDLVRIVSNPTNLGLSKAFNHAVGLAGSLGASHVILLDQDSNLRPGGISRLLEASRHLASRFPLGAVGATNREQVPVSFAPKAVLDTLTEDVTRGERPVGEDADHGSLMETRSLMNSGMLFPLSSFRTAAGFNEQLFVDDVDYDFSLRLREQGLRLFRVADVVIDHRQGTPYSRKFLGGEQSLRTYSPQRSYHLLLDTCRFARIWFYRYPGFASMVMVSVLASTVGALLWLPERRERFEEVSRALHHVLR